MGELRQFFYSCAGCAPLVFFFFFFNLPSCTKVFKLLWRLILQSHCEYEVWNARESLLTIRFQITGPAHLSNRVCLTPQSSSNEADWVSDWDTLSILVLFQQETPSPSSVWWSEHRELPALSLVLQSLPRIIESFWSNGRSLFPSVSGRCSVVGSPFPPPRKPTLCLESLQSLSSYLLLL